IVNAVPQRPLQQHSPESEPGPLFMQWLHRTAGNRFAGRWLQAKLKVGAPNDRYEQEADRMAEQVMRMPDLVLKVNAAPATVQRKCAECKEEDETRQLQRKESTAAAGMAPPIVHEALSSAGHPLDAATRAFMEPRFGHDFSQVRIRADADAARAARAVSAKAFTVGSDLVFGEGEYA